MTDRVGQQLGHYRLLRVLGQGAFAEVYLAEHLYLERPAAIKVLHVQMDPQTQEQFRREARILAHLQHPHIVQVLDFGFDDHTPYLVMEYMPGGTLRSRHPKGTRLPIEQIVTYVKQIASALDYAHQQRVIHRDIKPGNLLLNANHQVMLTDFGLAVVQHTLDSLSTQKPAGTPLYMAPEQIQRKPCAASDQYALGILVYEWLVGKTPFGGLLFEVFSQHLYQPPPSLRAALPDLPVVVEEAVFEVLAKNPEHRFACVADFASALEQACSATQPLTLQEVSFVPAAVAQEPEAASFSTQALPEGESALTVVPITALDRLPEAEATKWWKLLAVCRREGKPPFFLRPLGRVVGIRSLPTPHLVAEMGLTINALPHTFVLSDKLLGVDHQALVRLPGEVAASLSHVEQQNRTRLMKRVRATWIEGVLEHSLHQEALIALDLQEQPDALANPWQLEVQETNSPPRPLPAGISIMQVYDEAEGELLILGEPGAGKTTLLLQLARALLERAEHKERERLPVIFHLSSWAQKRLPLSEWLVEELQSKYQVPQKVGQAWIDADQVLPLLDGLDEVAQEAREDCIEAINTYRRLRMERGSVPLVVCCRSQEYLTLSTHLALQQAVSIQPLTNEQIEQYLQSAGGQLEALRQALQEDPVLDDLVHRPLILSVFTLAYQGVALQDLPTGETHEAIPRRVFAAYVERMLARHGVSKLFPREQTRQWLSFLAAQMQQHYQTALYLEYLQPDWLVDRQKRRLYQLLYALIAGLGSGLLVGLGSGLVFGLTRDLSFGLVGGLDSGLCFGLGSGLVGWLLGSFSASQCAERLHLKPNQGIWRSAHNGLVVGLVVGLIVGLGSCLVNVLVGALVGTPNDPLFARLTNPLRVGLFFGSSFGLPAGIGIGLFGPGRQIEPQEVLTWSWRKQRSATRLLWGVGGGLLTGLFIWLDVGLFWRASSAPFWGLVGGLVGELVFGLVGGLSTNQLDEHLRLKPNQGIWHSARNGLVVGLILGLVIGLAWGVASALSGEFTFGPAAWLVFCLVRGPAFGLFLGLLFFGLDALLQHFTLRFLLWRTGCLPWNLVAFLDEAAERLLLRKVGGGYIFIHRLLLDYFAALEKKEF